MKVSNTLMCFNGGKGLFHIIVKDRYRLNRSPVLTGNRTEGLGLQKTRDRAIPSPIKVSFKLTQMSRGLDLVHGEGFNSDGHRFDEWHDQSSEVVPVSPSVAAAASTCAATSPGGVGTEVEVAAAATAKIETKGCNQNTERLQLV